MIWVNFYFLDKSWVIQVIEKDFISTLLWTMKTINLESSRSWYLALAVPSTQPAAPYTADTNSDLALSYHTECNPVSHGQIVVYLIPLVWRYINTNIQLWPRPATLNQSNAFNYPTWHPKFSFEWNKLRKLKIPWFNLSDSSVLFWFWLFEHNGKVKIRVMFIILLIHSIQNKPHIISLQFFSRTTTETSSSSTGIFKGVRKISEKKTQTD